MFLLFHIFQTQLAGGGIFRYQHVNAVSAC